MARIPTELPLRYPVLSARPPGSASTVHEASPAGRRCHASLADAAGPSAGATPPRSRGSKPRVRLHLKPGQKGTKQLLARYGDRLVCVRYRYDVQRKKRFKTVELLVAERDWNPPQPRFGPEQIVGLRVAFAETGVREMVKQAGGTWNPERRVWQLRHDRVVELGLSRRIVAEPASSRRGLGPKEGNLPVDARTPSR